MSSEPQPALFADVRYWRRPESQPAEPVGERRVRLEEVNRAQLLFRPVDVERLVGPDHPARAIWELVGRLDLQEFEAECLSREGQAGRPGWPPRVLISVWIYGYSQGIASARAL